VALNARLGYNSYRYTIQPLLNHPFFAQDYSAQLRYTVPHNWMLSTSIMYTGMTNKNENLDQNYILWNASITKQLFKNKRGELTLSVNDLLNQQKNISLNAADNFVEFSENTTLQRFALFTFVYNINTSIKKK